MIEIVTQGGVSLDINPHAAFSIEFDNPLFEESRIPVPFSTAISFPPSPVNRSAFGYPDAMILDPAVKEIGATMFVNGIPLLNGLLTYDGISDRNLQYTFAAKDISRQWSAKLFELQGLPHVEGQAAVTEFISSVKNGTHPDVKAPLLVNANSVESTVYSGIQDAEKVDIQTKYHNENWMGDGFWFSPAVRVASILAAAGLQLVSSAISEAIEHLYILGLNRSEDVDAEHGYNLSLVDIASFLPDVGISDFVANLAKLFCAAIYPDGDRFRIVTAADIFGTSARDWDGKISDVWSVTKEGKAGYLFGYGKDPGEKPDTLSGLSGGSREKRWSLSMERRHYGTVTVTGSGRSGGSAASSGRRVVSGAAGQSRVPIGSDSYWGILDRFFYASFLNLTHLETGDIWSGHFFYVGGGSSSGTQSGARAKEYLCAPIWHGAAAKDLTGTDDESTFNNSTCFDLVCCMPTLRMKDISSDGYTYQQRAAVAPVVDAPTPGSDRTAEILIGVIADGQMCDHGRTMPAENGGDRISGPDLAPAALFEHWHRSFAEWLSTDRQVVTADINLTTPELAALRLWEPVSIRSRRFLIRKLSVRVSAESGVISSTADLISL